MKKLWITAVLFFGLPIVLPAQIVPRAAIFGGYTFVRAQQNGGSSFNLNGWDASLEGGFAPWLGIVADVSQQYGSPLGYQEKQTTALFGPQVSIRGIPRIVPFAHALVGVVHGTNSFTPPPSSPLISTGNAFATALGGGVDVKIAGPFYVRAIQADWLRAHLDPDHHTHLRLSSGVVLRFGGF